MSFKNKKLKLSVADVLSALRRQKQEDYESESSLINKTVSKNERMNKITKQDREEEKEGSKAGKN